MKSRLVLLLTLLGCTLAFAAFWVLRPHTPSADAEAASAGAAATAPAPDPVVDFGTATSAADVRAILEGAYRLRMDRRMLAAVADVRASLRGGNDEASAAWQDDHWSVTCGTDAAGEWPESPSFTEALARLEVFARAELAKAPLEPGAGDARAARSLAEDSPDDALGFLATALDSGTTRARLEQALVATTQIALPLTGDRSGFADAIAARALALLAIVRAAGGGAHAHEAGALAYAMGYGADARALSAPLPADDPVRMLARHEDDALLARAREASAGTGTRLAALLMLARRSRFDEWIARAHEWFEDGTPHVGQALETALLFARFDVQRDLPEYLCRSARTGLARSSVAGPWDVPSFELALHPEADRPSTPALRGLATARRRARFYSAVILATQFATHTLSSGRAVRRLSEVTAGPATGHVTVLANWQRDLAAAKSGAEPPRAQLREDLGQPALSAEMARITFDLWSDGAFAGAPDTRDAVRAFGQRLDSRPRDQMAYAWAMQNLMFWPEATERLLAAATAHQGDDDPRLFSALCFLRRDFAGLDALLARHDQEPREGLFVLQRWVGADSSAADRLEPRFEALHRRAPDDPVIARALASLREARGRLAAAERPLRDWLVTPHPDDDALDETVAVTQLARLRREQGDVAGALELIGNLDEGMQYGAMAEKARLLALSGDPAGALEVARRARERYPDSDDALGLAAEVEWRAGDPAAAARLVAELDPEGHAWNEGFVEPFLDVFSGRPQAAREALAAMRGVVPGMALRAWALGSRASARDAAWAMELMQEAPASGGIELTMQLGRSYELLARTKGEAAAVAWVDGRRVAPPLVPYLEMDLASRGGLAATWHCAARPGATLDDFDWLCRASAWRLAGSPAGPERDSLLVVARQPGGRYYRDVLRYLVGERSESDVLAIATDRHRRAEVWYYCAVRAHSEGRWRDAARWHQLVLETGAMRDGEWIWSLRNLSNWASEWCVPERLSVARERPAPRAT